MTTHAPTPHASTPRAPTPDAEGLAEPLRSRWSPTLFDPAHELTDTDVELLLEAARWAPSSGNSQPWGFVVARRGDDAHRAFVPHLSRGNAGWVPRASVVLVAGTRVALPPDAPADAKPIGPPQADVARYDLGQAAAHLTLQARAAGWHAHQFGGFDKDGAAAALGVPDHVQLIAGIAVGVPAPDDLADATSDADRDREARARTRRPLTEIAFTGSWGTPWPSP